MLSKEVWKRQFKEIDSCSPYIAVWLVCCILGLECQCECQTAHPNT